MKDISGDIPYHTRLSEKHGNGETFEKCHIYQHPSLFHYIQMKNKKRV